ncbi:MAG: hypothetical protein KAR16_05045 [Bacteroidales bacterium]|nr:hypothetical protein [Bacteroidales bacterium]
MRHRRTIVLIVSLLAVLVLLLLITDPWSTLGKESRQVVLRDVAAVDRIILVDAYDSTELVKVNGSWLLFGEEACSQFTVENLLIAASRLQISSIVTMGGEEGLATEHGETRRITWFKGDRALLTYGFTAVSERFLVIPPRSDRAYYVTVSGYPDLNLDKVFSSTSDHYREHLLIDLLPSEISRIEIELSSGEAFHFSQDSEGNIRMEADNEYTILPEEGPDEQAIRLLFSYFTSIRFEKRAGIPADSLSGSGLSGTPMATLHVVSFSGEDHTLRVYPYLELPGDEPHLFRALVLYNQEQEALFVNYIYLDVLMRGLTHYFGEK